MVKKASYALTTMAAISMTLLPVTAMEAPSSKSLTSINNSTDANNPIKESLTTNKRRCIDIPGTNFKWCFTLPDDD